MMSIDMGRFGSAARTVLASVFAILVATPASAYTVYTADLYPICRVRITLGKGMDTFNNPVVYDGPFQLGQSQRFDTDAGTTGTICAYTPLSNSDCARGLNQSGLCNADLRPGDRQIRQLRAPN